MGDKAGAMERNAVLLMSSEVLTKLLGMITTLLIARMLGVEMFGLYSWAYSIAGLALVIPEFGFERLAVREVARRPQRAANLLTGATLFKALLIVPAGVACALAAWADTPSWPRLAIVLLIFLAAALQNHLFFLCTFFRAIQKTERELGIRFLLALLSLLASAPLLLSGFGLVAVTLSRIATLAWSMWRTLWALRLDFGQVWARVRPRYVRQLAARSAPLALFSVCILVYMTLNTVLVGFWAGDTEAGYYAAALKLIEPLAIIPAGLSWAALPELSVSYGKDHAAFSQVTIKAFRYVLLLSIPMAMGMYLLSGPAVQLLFGAEYDQSARILRLLSFSLVPDFLNSTCAVVLISMNRERTTLAATATGALVTLTVAGLFIPRYGAFGGGLAWLSAETIIFAVYLTQLYPNLDIAALSKTILRVGCAAVIMCLAVIAGLRIGVHVLVLIPIGGIAFGLALVAVLELRKDEIAKAGRLLTEMCRPLLAHIWRKTS